MKPKRPTKLDAAIEEVRIVLGSRHDCYLLRKDGKRWLKGASITMASLRTLLAEVTKRRKKARKP